MNKYKIFSFGKKWKDIENDAYVFNNNIVYYTVSLKKRN